jgi:predicted TPR repeat methyltransferase
MPQTDPTATLFNKYAHQYQEKFMDYGLYHDSFDRFCALVEKQKAEVLEIGCGPGNITRYLLNMRPDLHILGIDIAENMLALAAINNPTASFQMMDCREIGTLGRKFDAIVCGFCLPYLSKEESLNFIREAEDLLNAGGMLYISTMEDDYSKSGFKGSSSNPDDKLFIHYHEAGYLTEALAENGFEILDLQRLDFPAEMGDPATDLILLARLTV